MSCDQAYTCTNQGQYRGCCVGSECATSSFPTVCYGATETQCSNPGPETMCCTYDINYPYCVTYLWATTASPNQVFSLFNCDTHDWAGQQILSAEPFAATTTNTSSAPNSQATVPANDNNNNNSGGGSSSTPVGAIVGGVIGGLAVIGLFVLCLVYLLLRYRRQKAARQLDTHHGGADEAALLSGPTSPAGAYGAPVIKAEQYGGTPSSMTQSSGTAYATPATVSPYTTLLHPGGEAGEGEGKSELGTMRGPSCPLIRGVSWGLIGGRNYLHDGLIRWFLRFYLVSVSLKIDEVSCFWTPTSMIVSPCHAIRRTNARIVATTLVISCLDWSLRCSRANRSATFFLGGIKLTVKQQYGPSPRPKGAHNYRPSTSIPL
ncbi:hypothetical protein GE09DRAFT_579237 [Coniochaeta sp. 2T2.1]|nr:hypothetical protein GE09DRAFT_579237 [Coniochaeta sp. 2T2.1]